MNQKYVITLTRDLDGKSLICEACNGKLTAETEKELRDNVVVEHMKEEHHIYNGQLVISD
jgi:uncharacterized protein with PIN domain